MSKEYDNTNRGVLFKNERKESDNHPDLTGNINIDGVEYWLSAWTKNSDVKGKYLSLSVKPKDERRATAPARQPLKQDLDDEIPF